MIDWNDRLLHRLAIGALLVALCWMPGAAAVQTAFGDAEATITGTLETEQVSDLVATRETASLLDVLASADTAIDSSATCQDAIAATPRTTDVTWHDGFCWKNDTWFQGLTGSAESHWQAVEGRNILLASSYSRADDFARLTMVDLDTGMARTVPLVVATGGNEVEPLESHAGGLAWIGDLLYLASTDRIDVFQLDQFVAEGEGVALVRTAHWDASTTIVNPFSTISARWTTAGAELITAQYNKAGTNLLHFSLDADGQIVANDDHVASSSQGLKVQRVSAVQGVEWVNGSYLLNSSNVKQGGESLDFLFVVPEHPTNPDQVLSYQMPLYNGQDLYADESSDVVWSLTEGPDSEISNAGDPAVHRETSTFVYSYSLPTTPATPVP